MRQRSMAKGLYVVLCVGSTFFKLGVCSHAMTMFSGCGAWSPRLTSVFFRSMAGDIPRIALTLKSVYDSGHVRTR